jgi:hypothetical protein
MNNWLFMSQDDPFLLDGISEYYLACVRAAKAHIVLTGSFKITGLDLGARWCLPKGGTVDLPGAAFELPAISPR